MNKKKMALVHSVIALLLCCSMLVGTTFAWFTDSVTSGKNKIVAGNLDVELYHSNAAVQNEQVNSATNLFMDMQGDPILWEPGVVSYENLRVANVGSLALTYQLSLNFDNENFVIDPETGDQYGLSQILKIGVVEGGITATDRAGVVASVGSANWMPLADFTRSGSLLAANEQVWGVVVYWEPGDDDNRWNLNNGKTLNEGETLQIDLGVTLLATQEASESDNFDNKYDQNARAEFFDGFQGGAAGAVVTTDDQGMTTAEVAVQGGDVSAVIPAGVQVADGNTSLGLSVTLKDASDANIQLGENEEMRPLDVHIEGVAQGNTVPMLITLKHYLSTGINTGALKLYHVENGATVAMTQVAAPANHNEFSYDPATGDVTLALASFSEVAVVADNNNPWDGTVATGFAGGSGTAEDPYMITNADQMAYFRNQVDGGNSFEGKYIKLENNITLSNVNFDPIGWGYEYKDWNAGDVAGKPFKGTFDGNGKIIFDLYQNGWDLDTDKENYSTYTYTNCGFGLFAAASGATFQNLTIYGANIVTECVEMGVLVGLSQNGCTYNNISIENSKIANYQRPAGGLIGEVSGEGATNISNVTIGADVVVGSLWGDFDAPLGGVIGARWDDAGKNPEIKMTNVKVHCRIDAYSDVTSAYQWYAYRRAGMLIGNTELTAENNPHLAAAPFLTCTNVEVCYGDWANYTYYQFTNQDNAWCNNYPWVRAEAGENCAAFSNVRYGQPVVNGVKITSQDLAGKNDTAEPVVIRFNQLYGGGQGVYGQPTHGGVTSPDCRYTITYINDGEILSVKYVTEDGAVSTENKPAQHLVELWGKDNINYDWQFGGWMTAASAVITEVPADNNTDIVLYPYFQGVYTATFVDQNGEVLAWELFEEKATKLEKQPEDPKLDGFVFDHWEIRSYNEDGSFDSYGELNATNLAKVKCDITLYPYYQYNGDASLIPVDSDADGKTDYYQVAGYGQTGGKTVVEIPGEVNGIPVTTINADAFSSFDDLHSVRIPGNITAINSQSFTANQGSSWNPKRDTVTLYYEGDPAVWNAAMEKYVSEDYDGMLKQNWDNNMGESSCVFFLDAEGKVDLTKGYWELANTGSFLRPVFEWQYHEHPYKGDSSGCGNEHNNTTNYSGNCDCSTCEGATRPDAQYWN